MESWQDAGIYDDTVPDTSWSLTGGAVEVRPAAQFDDLVWDAVESLIRAVQSRDHAEISHAMDVALGQNLRRRVGVKQALRMGVWCALTALSPSTLTDAFLQDLADRIFPMTSSMLTVESNAVVLVMGDGLRVFDEPSPTYSLPEAEFILVSAVALSDLLVLAPAFASGLDAIRAQCALGFSGAPNADVKAAWLSRIARQG